MDGVNKTLYIPLYGKAFVSKKGVILDDKTAEDICAKVQFPLNKKAKSKWLAYYMAMRARVFDEWTTEKIKNSTDALVLHLGCGLDSRKVRISAPILWYDVDFSDVINERNKYYNESENYKMLSADIRDISFVNNLPQKNHAIVILEGVSMYVDNDDLKKLLSALKDKFNNLSILLDCYTPFAVKMSKIKNPVKDVGVNKVFGIKSPDVLEETGVKFKKEHVITPIKLINQLTGFERFHFKRLYAGKIAKSLYKLYEYEC